MPDAGWEVLHNTMRSLGIESRQDLSEWSHNQGLPRPRWRAHFGRRAQERIWNAAIARDVRGIGCEALYVHIVMEGCRGEDHGSGGARARHENASSATDRLGGP